MIKKIFAVPYDRLQGPGLVPEEDPIPQVESIISTAFAILTIIGVIYFAIQIILAGYSFMSSQGDVEKAKVARKKLTNGILGITIVAIAFGLTVFLSKLLGMNNIFDLQIINDFSPAN